MMIISFPKFYEKKRYKEREKKRRRNEIDESLKAINILKPIFLSVAKNYPKSPKQKSYLVIT